MIPYEFTYFRPHTVTEAVTAWRKAEAAGSRPIYYSGGTEIITLARVNELKTGAVIDLKEIPENNAMETQGEKLVLGAALPLTLISEANPFPLLTEVMLEIADQTVRNKLTLGGNLSGKIIFRETSLPLLLAEADIRIEGPAGGRTVPLRENFNGAVQYRSGEFLSQVIINKVYTQFPYYTKKKRKQGTVGYPLMTLAAIKKDGAVRAAFSGVCAAPFRSESVENELNGRSSDAAEKAKRASEVLSDKVIDNKDASAEFRIYILKKAIETALTHLKEG